MKLNREIVFFFKKNVELQNLYSNVDISSKIV